MTKSALMVWGGWLGHSPKECTELFGPWLESEGYAVTISDTLEAYLDLEHLKSLDLIVPIWTQGSLGQQQTINLLRAVYEGVGIGGWHGCMGDSFRDNVDYQFLVGGQWVAHPGGYIPYKVTISDLKDSITQGLNDFNMDTEQYYMHVDPSNQVLATTRFKGDQVISSTAPYEAKWIENCVMPVAWKRNWGKGKVFYSSLGHKMEDFDIPEVLEITKRGILWASR